MREFSGSHDLLRIHRGLVKKAMVVLSVLSILGVLAVMIFLPQLLANLPAPSGLSPDGAHLLFLRLSALPLLILLCLFLSISLSLNRNSVFTDQVVKRLTGIQVCLLLDQLLYLYAAVRTHLLLAVVILLGCVMLLVLATLFKEVIRDGGEYYTDSSLSI